MLVVDQRRCGIVEFAGEGCERGLEAERVGLLPGPGVDVARPGVDPPLECGRGGRDSEECRASPREPPAIIWTSRSTAVRRVNMGLTPSIGVKYLACQSSGRNAGMFSG